MIGSRHPIAVQSMTNTPTADIEATLAQIRSLVAAGSELVRITVNDETAARAAVTIRSRLNDEGITIPLIGDFHFNGHRLLATVPELATALDKYRINPGNVGRGDAREDHFRAIIRIAADHGRPVRIGVNGGSLDPELLARLMDRNARRFRPQDPSAVVVDALVRSCLESARQAVRLGLPRDQIVLSIKASDVSTLIAANQALARETDHPIHLGLTEAGGGMPGMVATSTAIGVLLSQGIGDTIRASITPTPGAPRADEVALCRHILQSLGIRRFFPMVISCPGCGRTASDVYQTLARDVQMFVQAHMEEWGARYPGVERLRIAVMGCIVNGPGESREADVGICLPGSGEGAQAMIFIDGRKTASVPQGEMVRVFMNVLEEYIRKRFGGTDYKGGEHGRL